LVYCFNEGDLRKSRFYAASSIYRSQWWCASIIIINLRCSFVNTRTFRRCSNVVPNDVDLCPYHRRRYPDRHVDIYPCTFSYHSGVLCGVPTVHSSHLCTTHRYLRPQIIDHFINVPLRTRRRLNEAR
jgi:hypothetical protein